MKFHFTLILVFSLVNTLPLMAQDWQKVYDLALSAYNENQLVEAMSSAENAMELAETQFGVSSEPFSYSAQLLSVACYEAGEFNKGIQSARREMESNQLRQVHDTTYAKAVGNLILNYQGAGQVNESCIAERSSSSSCLSLFRLDRHSSPSWKQPKRSRLFRDSSPSRDSMPSDCP